MESWRKKYRNNFAVGTSISITVHLLLFLILFFFPPVISESPLQYFDNSYIVKLASVNIGKVDIGGGGSDGSEGTGRDFSSAKTLSGIPVPVSELTDIEFGKEANLIESKDSLLISGGGGLGAGSGGIGGGKGSGMGDGSGSGSGYISLPFVPRQILEVVPQNVEGVKGTIILVLKIGTDGFVKEDKIIYNTTNNSECLKNTIEAAYKSRWEQIKIEGKQIQYWIEKTYKFN